MRHNQKQKTLFLFCIFLMNFNKQIISFLSIIAVFCTAFNYESNHPQFKKDVKIDDLKPDGMGNGKYTLSSDLPAGLSIDETTGYISGTPTTAGTYQLTVFFNKGEDDADTCSLMIFVLEAPVINCGISKLTSYALINTEIECSSTGNIHEEDWSISPNFIRGIEQRGSRIIFNNFDASQSRTITISGSNEGGKSSYTIEIVKIENPTLYDGIYVRLNDLTTTPCDQYYDGIEIYNSYPISGSMSNLNDLKNQSQWISKMNAYFSGVFTTFNGTLDGFIDIETTGEYTFYLQTGKSMGARVYIEDEEILSDWGECKEWNEIPLSKSITLESGLKRVFIEIMGGEGLDMHFVFDYSTPGNSERKTIPFKYTKAVFDPVSFLSADGTLISWLNDAINYTPLHVLRGKADSCWISNNNEVELPEGSEITTDYIKGHPQENMDYKTYKIKCKNSDSETNEISIQLRVTSKVLPGVVAYYYKPHNFDTKCETQYGPTTDGLEPVYIQRQENVEIVETEDDPHPEGLSIDFLDDYAAYFESYLRIKDDQPEGVYNFRVQCEGGCWVYFNNEIVVNKAGRNSFEDAFYFNYTLTYDYLLYQVYYSTHNGYAKVDIQMKYYSDNNYDYNIQEYYVPSSDHFVMTQRYATYINGQTVSNQAIPVENFYCKSVTVEPTLPAGLMALCRSTAIIGGNVESDFNHEVEEYTVTIVTTDGNSYSYPIYIGIKTSASPSGLYIQDLETGEIYKETISLIIGKFYSLQFHIEKGYVISFRLENTPVGFSYDWKSSTLSGSPVEELNSELDVIAMVRPFDGDRVDFKFGLTAASGCESGSNMHAFVFSSDADNGYFTLLNVIGSDGTTIIDYSSYGTIDLPFTMSQCMKTDNYTIYTNAFYDYTFSVYNNGVKVYKSKMNMYETSDIILNTDPVLPVFKYFTSNVTIYLGNEIILMPRAETFVDSYTINPTTLPDGIFFNNNTGRIYGKPRNLTNSTKYTITGINGKGQATFDILMSVIPNTEEEDCENAEKFLFGLKMSINEFPERVGYELKDWNGNMVFNRIQGTFEANTDYTIKMCLTKGWYTLRLIDYTTYGWGGSTATLYAGDSIIGKYTVNMDDDAKKDITMDCINIYYYYYYYYIVSYLIDTHTAWQYSQIYQENWEYINFTNYWQSERINKLNKASSSNPTYYLRYALTFNDHNKYSGYFIRFTHKSGVIIRINGREIFRDNLPSVNVNENTQGDAAYEIAQQDKFILPIDDLNTTAIISIEIHRSPTDDNFPNEDKFFLFPLDGDDDEDCILITLYGGGLVSSSSESYCRGYNCADSAFDINDDTIWEDDYGTTSGQSYADYTFGRNNYFAFNQFKLVSNVGSYINYPTQVSLTGKVGSVTYNLGEMNPVSYIEMKKYEPSIATFNVDPYTLYTGVRIDILKSNQGSSSSQGMRVNEINYRLCRNKKCPANIAQEIPEGNSNTYFKTNCSGGGLGERFFYCSNYAVWVEINSTCNEAPVFITSLTTISLSAGRYYTNEAIFEVSGNVNTYGFICSSCEDGKFIPGIEFSTSTGLLTGMAYKGGTYAITFTAGNSYGTGELPMTIIVNPTSDLLVWNYTGEVKMTVYSEYNGLQILWVESPSTVSYSAASLPYGLKIDSTSGLISGKPTIVDNSMYSIHIKNSNQEVIKTIRFIIDLPDDPVIASSDDKLELIYMYKYDGHYPLLCYAKELTYNVNKDLPKDLTYNKTNGLMSGKVTASVQSAETYTFSCTANGKTVSKDILVSIIVSDSPILVSKNDTVSIKAGEELHNVLYFTVSGSNLIFSIYPSLPSGISMDEKTGAFNGYAKSESRSANYTITVSNGKTLTFVMELTVEKNEGPVIPDSTVIKEISIPTGAVVSVRLFESIGHGLSVTVTPDLPDGFTVSNSGYLQGIAVADVEAKEYLITLTDEEGKTASVTVTLEFTVIKCPVSDGYPETVVGEQIVLKCGSGKSGFITRKCLYVNGDAVWQVPIDECSSSIVGPLIGIIIGCFIVGGVLFLGSYCIYVRVGGGKKHVRKTAEQMVDASNDSGVRI